MKYLVNLSGGSGSTVALARCIERYGIENVDAVFADTNSEHPTLYRLLDETERSFGVHITRLNDGRDVWDVFFEERLIRTGNGGCKAAIELKHKQLDRYRDEHYTPENCIVVLGMDWMEPERQERAVRRNAPYRVEFPLTWPKQLSKCEEIDELARYGMSVPDMYARGHKHNNCAGACVLAGHAQWVGLLQDDPARFERYAQKEAEWRKATGNDGLGGKSFSILNDRRGGGPRRSLTLYELKARHEAGESFREWRSTCNCMGYASDDESKAG
jgi:hypothetical protein